MRAYLSRSLDRFFAWTDRVFHWTDDSDVIRPEFEQELAKLTQDIHQRAQEARAQAMRRERERILTICHRFAAEQHDRESYLVVMELIAQIQADA